MSNKLLLSFTLASLLASHTLLAEESMDADLGGFDTQEVSVEAFDDLDGFGESDESGDDLDGFGDDDTVDEIVLEVQKEQSNLSISGNIAFKTNYGYHDHSIDSVDYQGFNQAQSSLYLQLDYKINSDWKIRISGDGFYDAVYDLRDQPYNDNVLDTYKTQLRFDDTYIQGRLTKDIDIKIGRQLVVWGKSDSIRITDVINPLDNRLPGMTDIEDLRLSTTMAKLDYYLGQWNFSAMAIVESRIFLEAAPYGEYFPVSSIFPGAPNPFFDLKQPTTSWDNMQYAFAANGTFSGWDLSFYGADVLDSKWGLVTPPTPTSQREVNKIQMLGSAINIATGSWLLKSEIAYLSGIKYNTTKDEKDRIDFLVGADYMGIKDTVLSVEIANRHIIDHENIMSVSNPNSLDFVDENEVQTAIRATRSFSNDSINATLLLSMFGGEWQYGGFFRASIEYDVMDGVVANVGVIDYITGDKPFTAAISDNDKIFADITYSF